jgi:hypothetical protein
LSRKNNLNSSADSREHSCEITALQPSRCGSISINVIAIWVVFPSNRVTVQLNMSEQNHRQLPLAKRTARNRISADIWEQIKTAYAAGIGLREIARKMNIPEGTVLAHAKRHGWTQQLQLATHELGVTQSDAITPVQSVAQSLAVILSERKDRTKLGLSKYAAEAAERAGESDGDLALSRNVRDVAAVHSTLWPEDHNERGILNLNVLCNKSLVQVVQPLPDSKEEP